MKQRKIVTVVGKTGYGKSHLVKNQMAPLFKRIIIFDVMSEYDYNGFLHITNIDEFHKYMINHYDSDNLKVILRLPDFESYEFAFEIIYKAQSGIKKPLCIIIEEIWNFASPHYYVPALEDLIRFGRHYEISLIGISQRVKDLGALYLNNSDMIICFNLTDINDIKRLSSISFIGETGSEKVSKLKRYQHEIFENT